jgi:hypothetical protein
VLEYFNFLNFQPVIEKAKEACAKSAHAVADHLAEMRNMVAIGSGAQRVLGDGALSRYGCYLVIQNADPSKPLVALGQSPQNNSRTGWHDAGESACGRKHQESRQPREKKAHGRMEEFVNQMC